MPRSFGSGGRSVRELTVDRAAGLLFTAFSVLVLWESRKIPFGTLAEPGPGAVPMLLALTLLACSIVVVLGGRVGKRMADGPNGGTRWLSWGRARSWRSLSNASVTGSRSSLRCLCWCLVERNGRIAGVVFAGVFLLRTYYLFNTLLRVTLPQGPFGM